MSEEPAVIPDSSATGEFPEAHSVDQGDVDRLGEVAIDQSVVSPTDDHQDVIDDPDKAYEVAKASEEVRGEWAASQLAGDTMDSIVAEKGQDAYHSLRTEREIEGKLKDRGLEVTPSEIGDLVGRPDLAKRLGKNTSHRNAERDLQRAERLEHWAGVLYDKPLSSEYISQHFAKDGEEDRKVTAAELAHIEEWMLKEQTEADELSNSLARIESEDHEEREALGEDFFYSRYDDGSYRYYPLMPSIATRTREHLSAIGDRAKIQEYTTLDQADGTTNSDRKDFFDRLCQERAQHFRTSAALKQKLLDDISSGRASSSTVPEEGQA